MVDEATWSRLLKVESRMVDLEKVAASLNTQVADLRALFRELLGTELPEQFGHLHREYGGLERSWPVKAQVGERF